MLSVVKRLMAMVCTGVPRLPAIVTGPNSVHSSTFLLVVVATTNLQGKIQCQVLAQKIAARKVLHATCTCDAPKCSSARAQSKSLSTSLGATRVMSNFAWLDKHSDPVNSGRMCGCCAPSSSADDVAHHQATSHPCMRYVASGLHEKRYLKLLTSVYNSMR